MKIKSLLPVFLVLALVGCNDKPLATIGVVTDIHYYREKPVRINRYYTMSADKLAEAVDTFNAEKVDFTVSLGDTFDPDLAWFQDIDEQFARLDAPVYKLLGNHDCIAPYGSPEENAVLEALGLENPYFSIVENGIRFIFIDGNDVSLMSTAEGTPERLDAEATRAALLEAGVPYAAEYNGKFSQKQLDWLNSELAAAHAEGEMVILFGHMPLMPRDIDAAQWDGAEIDALLQEYPEVNAVLTGHHHHGAHMESGHIQHYTFQGMIEGQQNHYAVVRIFKDRIEITGYGEQPSCTLKFL